MLSCQTKQSAIDQSFDYRKLRVNKFKEKLTISFGHF